MWSCAIVLVNMKHYNKLKLYCNLVNANIIKDVSSIFTVSAVDPRYLAYCTYI